MQCFNAHRLCPRASCGMMVCCMYVMQARCGNGWKHLVMRRHLVVVSSGCVCCRHKPVHWCQCALCSHRAGHASFVHKGCVYIHGGEVVLEAGAVLPVKPLLSVTTLLLPSDAGAVRTCCDDLYKLDCGMAAAAALC